MTIPATPPSQENNHSVLAEKLLYQKLLWCSVIGAFGLIGYPLIIEWNWSLFFSGILLALASFGISFFIGTLFGMPKRNATADSDYTLNNSLVEISDWLTKIIVGLGLVNLQEIPGMLMNMAAYVKRSSKADSAFIEIFSISALLYFGVLGLYLGYNYMRLVLSNKYKLADEEVLAKMLKQQVAENKKLEEKVQEKQLEIKEQQDSQIKLLKDVNKPKEEIYEMVSDGHVAEMERKAQRKLSSGLIANQHDPHKSQWGGSASNNFRKISATVEEISKSAYRILVQIRSTDPERHPLADDQTVLFAIHPTYGDPPFRLVRVNNGVAELKLYSYGSFTIGALVDFGETELELDLAELEGVSDAFKNS